MSRSLIGIVLVAVGLVGLAWSGAALVDAQESDDEVGEEVEEPSITLEELRDGGTPLPDAPPGMRSDGERIWWVDHWPADAVMGSEGTHDDQHSERVDPTTTVDRTSVYLRTVSVSDRERTETVKVAFWQEGEREVEDGNVTRTEPVAEEVRVVEHEVSYQAGMPIMEIPLGNADEPRQVTIWIEGGPRWTFTHDPVATAESIGVSTVGDFWGLAALYLVLPVLGGLGVGGVIGKRTIERAGMGPGYPIPAWFVGIGLALGLISLFWFSSIAELVGSLPWVVAIFVSLVALVVIVESQAVRSRSVEFVRPEINKIGGPDGSEAVEVLDVERRAETVVDMPSGDPAVVRKGLRPFLARVFGRSARLPSLALDTRIDVADRTKSTKRSVEELIVVDPESSSVLSYDAEGFEVEPPSSRDEMMRVGSIAAVSVVGLVALGMSVSWLWAVLGGFVVGAVLLLSPVDGTAEVDPAKAHVRSAWISSMLLSRDVDDARTLEEARETIISQQGRGERRVQEAIESQDATLVEEMLGTEVSRTLDDERGPDVYQEELNDGEVDEDDEETEEAVADD